MSEFFPFMYYHAVLLDLGGIQDIYKLSLFNLLESGRGTFLV